MIEIEIHGKTLNYLKRCWLNEVKNNFDGKPPVPEGFKYKRLNKVWNLIESDYLFKYRTFYRVNPDLKGNGIITIAYPGSLKRNMTLGYGHYGFSIGVVKRFVEWQNTFRDWYEGTSDEMDENGRFIGSDDFHDEGESLAIELKKAVGEDCYVEYYLFHEITNNLNREKKND